MLNNKTIYKYITHFLLIFIVLIVTYKIFINALHPSLHSDESLYIAAGLSILSGDLFLKYFWFDKPIFQALWAIPGILVLGKTLLGFKLSALTATLITLIKTNSIHPNLPKAILILIAGVYFTSPYNISYFSSNMGEPFLALFFINFVRNCFLSIEKSEEKYTHKAYFWFVLALCTKQSAIMWSPMFLIFVFQRDLRLNTFYKVVKDFIISTKWIWIITLFFQITYKRKFASIIWFSHLSKDKVKIGFFEHLAYWSKTFIDIQRSHFIGITLILFFLIYCFLIFRKLKGINLKSHLIDINDPKIDLYFIILPLVLHFLGLSLSNAAHFDRYIFIFNVQFILVFIRLIYLYRNIFTYTTASILSFIFISINLNLSQNTYFRIKVRAGLFGYQKILFMIKQPFTLN